MAKMGGLVREHRVALGRGECGEHAAGHHDPAGGLWGGEGGRGVGLHYDQRAGGA